MTALCENFIAGRRIASASGDRVPVTNPASGETLCELPFATAAEVEECVAAASGAFRTWGQTPVMDRARVLYRFREKLLQHADELAELIVLDNGKTLGEARGDVQRGLEVVEFATGIPSHGMGSVIENLAAGIDCELIRQPLGVVAGLTPFNFPVMVPLWMIPIALACGNTFILKPSERAPIAAVRLAELFAECGAPAGTLNVIHGTAGVAEALMAHPDVLAISFVGSSPVARQVYANAAAHGKRVQALGGAKNMLIVLEDANLPPTVESIIASGYGCAGQRCLAGSNVVAVGNVAHRLVDQLADAAAQLRLGSGLDPKTKMGPVITQQARERVLNYVDRGLSDGAKLARDGRNDRVAELPAGYFVGPVLFDDVEPEMAIARDEIFGPLLSVLRVRTFDDALELLNASPLGNSASLYTTRGDLAREFRRRAQAGMLGINLGVPAPTAWFPFSGWKGSFFGDLHTQGRDGIEFYTRRKVVTQRWV